MQNVNSLVLPIALVLVGGLTTRAEENDDGLTDFLLQTAKPHLGACGGWYHSGLELVLVTITWDENATRELELTAEQSQRLKEIIKNDFRLNNKARCSEAIGLLTAEQIDRVHKSALLLDGVAGFTTDYWVERYDISDDALHQISQVTSEYMRKYTGKSYSSAFVFQGTVEQQAEFSINNVKLSIKHGLEVISKLSDSDKSAIMRIVKNIDYEELVYLRTLATQYRYLMQ